jgi:hypothetical protein
MALLGTPWLVRHCVKAAVLVDVPPATVVVVVVALELVGDPPHADTTTANNTADAIEVTGTRPRVRSASQPETVPTAGPRRS